MLCMCLQVIKSVEWLTWFSSLLISCTFASRDPCHHLIWNSSSFKLDLLILFCHNYTVSYTSGFHTNESSHSVLICASDNSSLLSFSSFILHCGFARKRRWSYDAQRLLLLEHLLRKWLSLSNTKDLLLSRRFWDPGLHWRQVMKKEIEVMRAVRQKHPLREEELVSKSFLSSGTLGHFVDTVSGEASFPVAPHDEWQYGWSSTQRDQTPFSSLCRLLQTLIMISLNFLLDQSQVLREVQERTWCLFAKKDETSKRDCKRHKEIMITQKRLTWSKWSKHGRKSTKHEFRKQCETSFLQDNKVF